MTAPSGEVRPSALPGCAFCGRYAPSNAACLVCRVSVTVASPILVLYGLAAPRRRPPPAAPKRSRLGLILPDRRG